MGKLTIKKVTIVGMHNVKHAAYDFSKLTYLHGNNGVGKSTIMEAIQLALLGYIPGKGKTKELIFRHAGEPIMSIMVVLVDDTNNEEIIITRTWKQSGNTVNSDVSIIPADTYSEDTLKSWMSNVELPIFNFNEFIGMTANRLKDWFIKFMPTTLDPHIDWRDTLCKHVTGSYFFRHELLDEVIRGMNTPAVGVEGVREVNDYLKRLLSFKNGELERTTSGIQSLVFHDDIDSTLSEWALVEEKSMLTKQRDKVERWKLIQMQNAQINAQLMGCPINASSIEEDIDYQNLQTSITERKNAIDKLADAAKSCYERVKELEATIVEKTKVVKGNGICPYSKARCSSIEALVRDYEAEIIELKLERDNVHAQMTEHQNECAKLREAYNLELTKLKDIENTYARHAQLTAMLVDSGDIDQNLLSLDFDTMIKAVDDKLIKIKANEKYTQLVDTLAKQKYQIEQDIECLKCWIKLTDVNGMQSRMTVEPFEQFASSIDEYLKYTMGPDVNAAFNIVNKANSFSFGITRNNTYIPFDLLSSGEKCLYALALMITINSSCSDRIGIIMVDDLLDHLDDENIDKLFDGLSKEPSTQFIFAGVKNTNSVSPNIIEVKRNA